MIVHISHTLERWCSALTENPSCELIEFLSPLKYIELGPPTLCYVERIYQDELLVFGLFIADQTYYDFSHVNMLRIFGIANPKSILGCHFHLAVSFNNSFQFRRMFKSDIQTSLTST